MYKKIRFENILIIILALILIITIVIIIFINEQETRKARRAMRELARMVSPTIPQKIPALIYAPTTYLPPRKPVIKYDESAQNQLLEKVRTRTQLSETDKIAKTKILNLLPKEQLSGIVHATSNANIEYIQSPDVFMVEILTSEINLAKNEVVDWFLEQGFSQDAICNHPVPFYLNWEIANQLSSSNIIFSPLAPNCQ